MITQADSGVQDGVNRRVYHRKQIVGEYLWPELWRTEAMALLKYQPAFAGRDVLDLGVGAGRTSRFLAPLARRYEGIDYSPFMVQYMREEMPQFSVRLGDMRDLSPFADGSFDFVLGANNVIAAISHDDRLRTLSEVWRVLRPGGTFMFSCHNRRYNRALGGPRLRISRNPVTLGRNVVSYVRSTINHRRVGKLRRMEPTYALLNDYAHDYALLHYYIDRDAQTQQLTDAGFRLLDVFNDSGAILGPHDRDDDSFFLMYVAIRDAKSVD